jgi:hypothetical protein
MEDNLPLTKLLKFSLLCELLPYFASAPQWGSFLRRLSKGTKDIYETHKVAFINLASEKQSEYILSINSDTYSPDFWSHITAYPDLLNYSKLALTFPTTIHPSFNPKIHQFIAHMARIIRSDPVQKLTFKNINFGFKYIKDHKYTQLYTE